MNRNDSDADSGASWFLKRVRRHAGWLRTEGAARLIEEDDLNVVDRVRRKRAKQHWAAANGAPGQASAVFVVGLQRSGTNLVMRLLDRFPETEVHNENSRVAFDRFRLKQGEVASVVDRSPHRLVVFKPLMDSHAVTDLLAIGDPERPARAIWVYRNPDARARSAVAKFGSNNLEAAAAIARGQSPIPWQAEGLSAEAIELAAAMDYEHMTPESGAILMWYLRNIIFFEQGLDRRDDILLLSYDMLVESPSEVREALLRFVGLSERPGLFADDEVRTRRPTVYDDVPPDLRRACDELQVKLDQVAAAQMRSLLGETQ